VSIENKRRRGYFCLDEYYLLFATFVLLLRYPTGVFHKEDENKSDGGRDRLEKSIGERSV